MLAEILPSQNDQNRCENRGHLSNPEKLTKIKLPKKTVYLMKVYCIWNDITMREFMTNLIEKELSSFRRKIEDMKT